jgi:hypothetical protein
VEAGELLAQSLPSFVFFDDLCKEVVGNPVLRAMRNEVLAGGHGD